MDETRKPRLRWFQYSLRSLLLVMLLASIAMSWVAVRMQKARKQKEAVEEIKKSRGWVEYHPGPAWLRNLLGEDCFATVVHVSLHSQITDAGFLKHLKGLTQLQQLDLNGTPVTDASLEHLKGLTQLQQLDLGGAQVTDAGLEHLKGLTQLQTLELAWTHVTDAGLEHLKGLTQLRTLDLNYTKVTDEGLKKLQQALPNCKIIR